MGLLVELGNRGIRVRSGEGGKTHSIQLAQITAFCEMRAQTCFCRTGSDAA